MTAPLRGMSRPEARPVRTVVVSVVAVVLLVLVGLAVRSGLGHAFDLGTVLVLNRANVGGWAFVVEFLYGALEPVPAVVLTAVLTGIVWLGSRSFRTAVGFAGVVALTWLPSAALKLLIDRPRPPVADLAHPFVSIQTDGSFPSGHTTFVAALAIACWFLARDSAARLPVALAGIVAVGVMVTAVVGAGLHYPSDTAASIVWALAMAPTARLLVVDVMMPRLEVRVGRAVRRRDQAGVPSR